MFLKLYCQTYEKALNGNNNLTNKEGFYDNIRVNKIYGVIDNAYFSRSILTPYYFYEKQVIQNKKYENWKNWG